MDILRFIALSGIILIHTDPHSVFWSQLRGFDVPMMVFLSGVVFFYGHYSFNNVKSVVKYEWQRIRRILFPTWIFLCFYWVIMWLYTGSRPSIAHMKDLLLLKTDWYIWIMRVFLIVALAAPLVVRIKKKLSFLGNFMFAVLLLILFNFFALEKDDSWMYYITMSIPYVLIFAYGSSVIEMERKHICLVCCFSALVYFVYVIYNGVRNGVYVDTQLAKYPPRLYYTSFAMLITTILWWFRHVVVTIFEILHFETVAVFIGSHTMWIYLWHIVMLEFIETGCWYLDFLFVYIGAIIITLLQNWIIELLNGYMKNETIKCETKRIFGG